MYAGRTHVHTRLALVMVASIGLLAGQAAAKIEKFERVPTLEDLGAHLASGLDPRWLVPRYDYTWWKLDSEVLGWETNITLATRTEASVVTQKLWNNLRGTNFQVEVVPFDETDYGSVKASIECSFKDLGKDRSHGLCSWSIQSRHICSCGEVEHRASEATDSYIPLEIVEIEREDNAPQQSRRGVSTDSRGLKAGPMRLR